MALNPRSFARHVILYMKGQYGDKGKNTTEIIEDLRWLFSLYTGVPLKRITDNDIYVQILEAFTSTCSPRQIQDALIQIFSRPRFQRGCLILRSTNMQSRISMKRLAQEMLIKLAILRVRDGETILLDLGKPDLNIIFANAKIK